MLRIILLGDGEAGGVGFIGFFMAEFTIKNFTILLVLEMKAILASFYGYAHNA